MKLASYTGLTLIHECFLALISVRFVYERFLLVTYSGLPCYDSDLESILHLTTGMRCGVKLSRIIKTVLGCTRCA